MDSIVSFTHVLKFVIASFTRVIVSFTRVLKLCLENLQHVKRVKQGLKWQNIDAKREKLKVLLSPS